MGNEAGKIRPVPNNFPAFSVRVNSAIITTVHASHEVLDATRQQIVECWKAGIKEERRGKHPSVHVYKLSGKFADDFEFWKTLPPYKLMVNLVKAYRSLGYSLVAAPDIFLTLDNAELVFYRTKKKSKAHESKLFGMHVFEHNQLHLINAPDAVLDGIKIAMDPIMEIDDVKHHPDQVTTVLSVDASPWSPTTERERVKSVRLLLAIFKQLEQLGYRFEGGACLDGFVDTWFWAEPLSKEAPLPPGEFAAIALERDSEICLFNFNKEAIKLVEKALDVHWRIQGVQDKEIRHGDVTCFTLNENPWTSSGDIVHNSNDVHAKQRAKYNNSSHQDNLSRMLILHILQSLDTHGWPCLCATDISSEADDKSLFIFRQSPKPKQKIEYIALQPSGRDSLWVLNADAQTKEIFTKVFTMMLGEDVLLEQQTLMDHTETYKVAGSIWQPMNQADVFVARHTINVAIAALLSRDWIAVCDADIMGNTRLVRMVYDQETGVRKPLHPNDKTPLNAEIDREECDVHMMVFKKSIK